MEAIQADLDIFIFGHIQVYSGPDVNLTYSEMYYDILRLRTLVYSEPWYI